jgi:hypothetical protein
MRILASEFVVVSFIVASTFALAVQTVGVDSDSPLSNLLVNGNFEAGTLRGWQTSGQCRISVAIIRNGSYSAYVSDEVYDSWVEQIVYPAVSSPVNEADFHFEGWVYPLVTGYLGTAQHPSSSFNLTFNFKSSMSYAFSVYYLWSWSEGYYFNTTSKLYSLLSFSEEQWNFLSQNVTEDASSYFGIRGFNLSNIVLYSMKADYHYSNVSPGAFYVDDLVLTSPSAEQPEIREVTWQPTCPPPYIPSNQTRMKEPVLVKVDAVGSIQQAVLKFRKQGEDWFNVSMKFNSTEGLWYQIIPGQSENCTIELFIEAYDNLGFIFVSQTYSYSVKSLSTGDINGDNFVGIDDIFTVAKHFGEENP